MTHIDNQMTVGIHLVRRTALSGIVVGWGSCDSSYCLACLIFYVSWRGNDGGFYLNAFTPHAQAGMPSEGEDEVGEDLPLEEDDDDSDGHASGGHAGYK